MRRRVKLAKPRSARRKAYKLSLIPSPRFASNFHSERACLDLKKRRRSAVTYGRPKKISAERPDLRPRLRRLTSADSRQHRLLFVSCWIGTIIEPRRISPIRNYIGPNERQPHPRYPCRPGRSLVEATTIRAPGMRTLPGVLFWFDA